MHTNIKLREVKVCYDHFKLSWNFYTNCNESVRPSVLKNGNKNFQLLELVIKNCLLPLMVVFLGPSFDVRIDLQMFCPNILCSSSKMAETLSADTEMAW